MEAVKIGKNMLKQKQTNKKNTLNQKHLKVANVSSFGRNLVIWSANVECLSIERLGELCHRMEISSEKPDIVCLQETWLDSDKDSDDSISITGYTLYRKDRKIGIHGGVAVYVKTALSTNMCCDLTTDDHEILWIRVTLANRVLLSCLCLLTTLCR
jgi:exonuclease III